MRTRNSFFLGALLIWIPLTSSLTLEEKVGELFVLPFCPERDLRHRESVARLIQDLHIGSIIVKQSSPEAQIEAINWIQSLSKNRLLVLADAEWGLGMRMTNAPSFPKNLTLGALQEDQLIYEIGKEIARGLKLVGVDMNLAPVADVNSNPENPIIQMRSFGVDPKRVSKKVVAMMLGLQDGGIFACGKHLPGHGNTKSDSHLELPEIVFSMEDLLPFEALRDAGVSAMLTGHLYAPTLHPNLPLAMTDQLQKLFPFQGLLITDALNMKALDRFTPEEIALKHLESGHDLLLYGDHIAPNVDHILEELIPRAYKAVLEAVKRGEIEIDRHVDKVLSLKNSLPPFVPLENEGIHEKLFTEAGQRLRELAYQKAIVAEGRENLPLPASPIRLQAIGDDPFFIEELGKIFRVTTDEGPLVIPIFSAPPLGWKCDREAILILFGSPYTLPSSLTQITAFENRRETKEAVLNLLNTNREFEGLSPIKLTDNAPKL